MSYVEIKPEYYRMHQPDSPWHAGSAGWKSAPWPSWGVNPNLVGPPRLAVEGLGAYYAAKSENPINGLGAYYAAKSEQAISGLGGCGCSGTRGVGAASLGTVNWSIVLPVAVIASITGLALYVAQKK
jgi:hypothetical protein